MMFTIQFEYLTGYAVATDFADRTRPEWPPHPARIFMALAAAHFETGADPAERDALTWLESQGDPVIFASGRADDRAPVTHFVPPNDDGSLTANVPLPRLRSGKERLFPRVRPGHPVVALRWATDPDADARAALRGLCAKVTRIGHSSSLVWMWVADDDRVDPALDEFRAAPSGGGGIRLRRVTAGSLTELRDLFRADDQAEFERLSEIKRTGRGKAKKEAAEHLKRQFNDAPPQPVRPAFRLASAYRVRVPQGTPHSVWDEQLVVYGLRPAETRFPRLDALASPQIARRLRDAAMSVLCESCAIPECLSGHAADGSPSQRPHVAFFALPFVADRHADGHVMGVAVALPRGASGLDRQRILGATAGVEQLTLGKLGVWRLVPADDLGYRATLDERTWTAAPRGAREWASVTPIAFDTHSIAVEEMIATACERVGLPSPVRVALSHVSAHAAAPTSRHFPPLQRNDQSHRRQLHARIGFDRPVVGPVLLAAGRYRGYGLMRPVTER
jgi:CRISPR-associated protein Csb2